ncbi:UNVERIFIED_CONTAM: hypothetical protein GTU68_043478, partial [Idotea baltica]|nr:hypothetical protein [Idotea baltica]
MGCHSGVMVTASHNPKEYNGYKVYGANGGQITAPHDDMVIKEVRAINSIDDVKFEGISENITVIGKEIDDKYISETAALSISKQEIKNQHDLKIVFSPIHGTGAPSVPNALSAFGFTNVTMVEEQVVPDGTFPTVIYPNPEEQEALSMALAKGKEIDADLIMATDPDADRVGIALEGKKKFIGGGEESYGYLVGE